jgi:quinol monooxygenase YgiN
MAITQMAMMGGSATGAAVWGHVAGVSDVSTSLMLAAIGALIGLLLTRRFKVGDRVDENMTPAGLWQEPEVAIPIAHDEGPVLVMVEYRIDPARVAEFTALMGESRRAWLSNGVLAWELFRDTADEGRYIEYFVDESWAEYVRRNDRVTALHLALRERKRALHVDEAAPRISRYIAAPVARF